MTRLSMKIEGMSCGHCVSAVREALDELPGVEVEQVTIGGAEVRYDPASTTPERVADAVRDAGYEPALS
jgi:copper chaperone CopZ